jgi:hypothetical protein
MTIFMTILLYITVCLSLLSAYPVSLGPKAGIMYTNEKSAIYITDQSAEQCERALMPTNAIQNPWHRKQGIEQQFISSSQGVDILFI